MYNKIGAFALSIVCVFLIKAEPHNMYAEEIQANIMIRYEISNVGPSMSQAKVPSNLSELFAEKFSMYFSENKEYSINLSESGAPKLHEFVEKIATKMNISKPRICLVVEPYMMNAYVTQIDRIPTMFIGRALLFRLNSEQFESVVVHELGHLYHNHLPKQKYFISIYPKLFGRPISLTYGLGNALLSRYCERQADDVVVRFYGDKNAMRETFQILKEEDDEAWKNSVAWQQNRIEESNGFVWFWYKSEQLYCSIPTLGLFDTHPSHDERIANASE